MNIKISPGKYVLALSGGIDSMVLLDLLKCQPGIELVVAHLNHGIRPDSDDDEKLAVEISEQSGIIFETEKAELGENASEEKARDARYKFLNKVKNKHKADGIITAHHQDDLIETAIINILRGTGPRGLIAMQKNDKIIRPLLSISKKQIIEYAKENKLVWREDRSNDNTKYLRNYVRHELVPKLGDEGKKKLIKIITDVSSARGQSDKIINVLAVDVMSNGVINRAKFINLPNEVGSELVICWLRDRDVKDLDRKTITRLSMALKTAKPGTKHAVMKGAWIEVDAKKAVIKPNR